MTLIASFEAGGTPVLIGDVLVTQGSKTGRVVATPLLPEVNRLLSNQPFSVSSLCQKVLVLHPQVCACWAGNYIEAVGFFRHLSDWLIDRPHLDRNELEAHMRQYGLPSSLDLIIYAKVDGGFLHFSNIPQFDLEGISGLRVAGSGTPFVVKNVEAAFNARSVGTVGDYQSVAMRALALCALASVSQILRSEGMLDRWGGAFEIIMFDGQEFFKPNLLWLHWDITSDGEHAVAHIGNKFMYQYCIDGDTFYWIDYGAPQPNEHFQVDAPHSRGLKTTLVPPSVFDTSQIIHLFTCNGPNEEGSGALIDFTGAGLVPSVRLARSGQQTTLQIDNSFFPRLGEQLPLTMGSLDQVDWSAWSETDS